MERASQAKIPASRPSQAKLERASQGKIPASRPSQSKLNGHKSDRPSQAKLDRPSKRALESEPPAPPKKPLWSRKGELFRSFVDALRDILRYERRSSSSE
jgi:hypothetical protein